MFLRGVYSGWFGGCLEGIGQVSRLEAQDLVAPSEVGASGRSPGRSSMDGAGGIIDNCIAAYLTVSCHIIFSNVLVGI